MKGLIKWIQDNNLLKVIHAWHFVDDMIVAENLIAADFIYTGCLTLEPSAHGMPMMPARHMIQLL
ncbi:hypothetical protein GCM10011273_26990 [Asticcacaulis endophyticus]|uniref:Uncharacterized protein n=2 Tax=Asticcacaulis endophyticus TaxID=1395890 RepID=A0A918UWY5_9CAUL|nr:hypothetical protein GCM10011273_26990 [Asticcacaulis endophyticus]